MESGEKEMKEKEEENAGEQDWDRRENEKKQETAEEGGFWKMKSAKLSERKHSTKYLYFGG